MDPFTISTGVLSCISIALKVLVGLKQLKANVGGGSIGSASIDVLAADITGLRKVLHSIEDTFQDTDDDDAFQEEDERGDHWRNLRQCLNDGHGVLSDFDEMLFDLNKKVKVLAPSRMQSRLQSAAARFVLVGQQVQAYKSTFQLCLEVRRRSTSSATHKASAEPGPAIASLDLHHLASDVETKIQTVEDALTGLTGPEMVEAVAVLKECAASAMAVLLPAPNSNATRKGKTAIGPAPSIKQEGVIDWINKSSAATEAARLHTPPSDDSSFETSYSVILPPVKGLNRAGAPAEPPTPTASSPSPGIPPTDTIVSPASNRACPVHHHSPQRLPAHQHRAPGPMIMYMAPVGWDGQKQNQSQGNTPMPPMFPVQVVYGPPPASAHQRVSLPHPAMPFRSSGPLPSPTSPHTHRSTASFPSTPNIDSRPNPQQPVEERGPRRSPPEPAIRPPPKVQPKLQLRTQQLPQAHAQLSSQPATVPRPEPTYGNKDKRVEQPVPKQKQTKLQKQYRASGITMTPPEKGDKQPPGGANRMSSGQPASAKRRSRSRFSGLRRLMSSSGEGQPSRQKLCFVGDSGCGKTSLLTAASKGKFLQTYEPTTFENYVKEVEVKGVGPIELEIWDTAGREEYDSLRSLSYPDSNALVLCFSIGDPSSYRSILERWLPEATRFCPETPMFVVGCKQDLRFDPKTIGNLQRSGQLPLTTAEGLAAAGRINARYYIETSAQSSYGVKNVLALIAEEILKASRSEPLVNVTKRIQEEAWLINEERRNLRASGEILTPREKHFASMYVRIRDEPNTTVWKLQEQQTAGMDRSMNASRSSLFRRPS